MEAKARKGILSQGGTLRLTKTALQFFSSGHYDELATTAAIDIPLKEIIQVSRGGYVPGYPIWVHVILFPMPLVAKAIAATASLVFKKWIHVRTQRELYRFSVRDQAAWLAELLTARRAAAERKH